ncbi:MAG: alpha-D-glucose phosphate-specific phosphoglucomutase [Planctomycetes bacterium]|nr:alpha-D-glucose phosphate-specific phosphoglucomutase [Planctomycetota bacterium]
MGSDHVHPRAGTPARADDLTDVSRLVTAYFARRPDPSVAAERVAFGTSGHRGSSLQGSFNELHILATTQALCEQRRAAGVDGPLFLGVDTHALSEPAFVSAMEVLAAHGVTVRVDAARGWTPTPAVSHAILQWNRGRTRGLADGIVVTPSHNPPEDGGFKYNPPHGGPADTAVTKAIEARANELLAAGGAGVARVPFERAMRAGTTERFDFVASYVDDLPSVVDLDAMRREGLSLAVDPLGGAGVAYWPRIAERHRIPLTVLSTDVDATFRFMTLDHDGRIRMDCSSPHAMRRLVSMRDRFDVAWACDTDHDRHGIVARSTGLLDPNRFLAACVAYLFTHRPAWNAAAGVGKTIVSSSLIDRVAARLQRPLVEVPVGFKWFVDGLRAGTLGFAGEESAGASLLRRDGTVWTTDKDGIALGLLAAEMTAVTGKDPGALAADLARELGDPAYARVDAPASAAQKAVLGKLAPSDVTATSVGGDPVTGVLSHAPGNGASIGGLKVTTAHGWFAVRPSGTENVYKLYAESFRGPDHLRRIQDDARAIVSDLFRRA